MRRRQHAGSPIPSQPESVSCTQRIPAKITVARRRPEGAQDGDVAGPFLFPFTNMTWSTRSLNAATAHHQDRMKKKDIAFWGDESNERMGMLVFQSWNLEVPPPSRSPAARRHPRRGRHMASRASSECRCLSFAPLLREALPRPAWRRWLFRPIVFRQRWTRCRSPRTRAFPGESRPTGRPTAPTAHQPITTRSPDFSHRVSSAQRRIPVITAVPAFRQKRTKKKKKNGQEAGGVRG